MRFTTFGLTFPDAAHQPIDQHREGRRGARVVRGGGGLSAVIDSGIDKTHPHFQKYQNLDLKPPLEHRDFTGKGRPLEDAKGHGSHVAGIIAGQFDVAADDERSA